jgi:16S rRNA (guanine(966)-N(2))-methyltransferase RsmD
MLDDPEKPPLSTRRTQTLDAYWPDQCEEGRKAGRRQGRMRVIAGSAKGIQLLAVPGSGTRPISDRVKENLFNILGSNLGGWHVLDLFAGTGSVGIEALSRGADRAVFVEKRTRAIETIRANLKRTKLAPRARVVKADVFKYLSGEPAAQDLIYIAPPQYLGLWSKALLAVDAVPGWVGPGGLVVVQVFPKEWEVLSLQSLEVVDKRKYGSTLLCFYEQLR